MTNKEFNRREFMKVAGRCAVVMATGSGCALFSTSGTKGKSRSHYNVFSKGKIGQLKLKNHIIKSATAVSAVLEDGHFLQEGYDIYSAWARGGASMIVSGHMTVVPMQEGTFPHTLNRIDNDGFLPQLGKLADTVHDADPECKIIAQINHIGNHPLMHAKGVGPSPVPWPFKKDMVPHSLTVKEIKDIENSFIAAAKRAKEAGFDGVELHAAHLFLLYSFLTPLTNKRTDHYGGSTHNRVRIIREIVEGIKGSVGGQFPVLLKVNSYDVPEGGVNIKNFPELAHELSQTGIDALHLSGANPAKKDIDSPEDQSYHAVFAKAIDVSIPVIVTGGNKSIELMEKLYHPGTIDFFGLARPLILEPDLPNRWLNGEGDAECDCISCNECILYYVIKNHKLLECRQV